MKMQYQAATYLCKQTGNIKYVVKSRGKEVATCTSMDIARRVARGLLLENIDRDKAKNFKL